MDEDRIVYKGTINVADVNKEELFERAKDAVSRHIHGGKKDLNEDNKEKGKITANGTIRLITPYHLIRTIGYILELSVGDGNYKYRIDSVYWKQVERGGKTIRLSSAELFKGIEETGPISVEAEKQLNEIDMNFQKILALINRDIRKAPVIKTP
jgi:hypothetical protein